MNFSDSENVSYFDWIIYYLSGSDRFDIYNSIRNYISDIYMGDVDNMFDN